jgi:cytosolic iron-sulfur protein assembly protein CIAO1
MASHATITPITELAGHADRVWHASFHPSRELLATCSSDRTVRIWQPRRGAPSSWDCVGTLDDFTVRTVRWCEWSPNGRYLAVTSFDGKAYVWELTGGGALPQESGPGAAAAARRRRARGPDGDGGDDDGGDEDGGGGYGAQFDEDASPSASSELNLELMSTLDGHENEVKGCAWSADGSLLATCGRDKSVWLWSVDDASGDIDVAAVLHGHTQDVKTVVWHPTRPILLSCSYDDTIKVWAESDEDWVCTDTLTGHESTVWDIALSADGRHLASVSDDLSLAVWREEPSRSGIAIPDLVTYRRRGTFPGHHSRTLFSVAWARWPTHAAGAGGAGSIGGGDWIATCGADDAIHIARLDAGPAAPRPGAPGDGATETGGSLSVVGTIASGHGSDVNCVRWHPRRRGVLVSVGDDNAVRLWQVDV